MNGFPPGAGGPFGSPPFQAPSPQAVSTPQAGAPAAIPGQPPPGVQVRYCWSGSLACSGCFPCEPCAQALKQYVLVPALLEEQAVLGVDLPNALQQGRGVNLQLLAETFFRMTAAAWKQLHETMQAMPPQQRQFRVMNLTALLAAAEVGRQVLQERERAAAVNPPPQNIAQPVAPPAPSPPVQPVVVGQVVMPAIRPSAPVDFEKAMRAGDNVAPSVITVPAEEPSAAAAPNAPTPRAVTSEDFARAATPVDLVNPSNGINTKAPS